MRVHLVLLLVTVWLATSYAGPQRHRQGEDSNNPLAMGMKFLGNMRNTMTSAISGLFSSGRPQSRPKKVRHQRPPHPQHQAPNAPQFHQVPEHVTRGPHNSFFTVVHEDDTVTQAAPAPQRLPLADEQEDDSFQPSSFFSSNEHFQGNLDQNIFTAPKGPNDFSFGHLKDDDKIHSTFSQGVNTRPTHQNFQSQSSGFQPGPGLQVVSPPNFPSSGFSQFTREEPIGFRQSSSSLSSSVSPSSSFSKSSSFAGNRPQQQLPLQDNHFPESFTVPDPQRQEPRNEPSTNKDKFTSEITPAKLKFAHHFTTSRPSTPIRRSTPSRIPARTIRPVVRPIPSSPKKPIIPAKSTTGDRHVNTGFKQQVVPKDGDKAAHISGYEWGYGVKDSDTGNQFFHAEKREEGTTKGSYKIQLPDGRIQTVTYTADDQGFHPVITYEGEAKFPDESKGGARTQAIGSVLPLSKS